MNGDLKISRQILKDNGAVFDKHGRIFRLVFGDREMEYLTKDVLLHMRYSRERENLPTHFTGISSLHIENGHVVQITADRLNSDAAIRHFPYLHRLDIKDGRLHLRHCPRLRSVVLHQDLMVDQTRWNAGDTFPLRELVRLRHECLYENGVIIYPEGEINTSIFQSVKSLENEFIGYQNDPDELGLYLLVEKCHESLSIYLDRENRLKKIGKLLQKKVFYEGGVYENTEHGNTHIIYYHPGHRIYTEIILNTEDVTKNQYNYYESADDLHMKKLRMMQVIADSEKLLASLGVNKADMLSERTQYFDQMKSIWSNMIEVARDHKGDNRYLVTNELQRYQKKLRAIINQHSHAHRGDYGGWLIATGKVYRLHLGDSLSFNNEDTGLVVGAKGGNSLKIFFFLRREETILSRDEIQDQVINVKQLEY